MHALGFDIPDSIKKGVFIHGLSGDLAIQEMGQEGVEARNILKFLPDALELDREGLTKKFGHFYLDAYTI